jgi:vacuolar-type H+-ATPase subunit H
MPDGETGSRADLTAPVSSTGRHDFTRLIEAERQMELRLVRAREEAGEIVRAARAEAEAREIALEHELAGEAAKFAAQVESERARRSAEILDQGRLEADRFRNVPADRIESLAGHVIGRLIGESP